MTIGMKEFQERRRIKKLLHSRYVIAILVIVCLLLLNAVWGVYKKYERSKVLSEKMKNDLAALHVREEALKQSIESLKTDEGKEREIRDRFGAIREGEKLVILVDDALQNGDIVRNTEKGFWRKFIGFFGF